MPSIGKCVSVRHASHRRGDPPPGTSRAFASCPALSFERRCDAALVRGPDPGEVDAQTVAGNLQNGGALFPDNETPDLILPSVGLVTQLLLRRDEFALECGIRPPAETLPVEMHGRVF